MTMTAEQQPITNLTSSHRLGSAAETAYHVYFALRHLSPTDLPLTTHTDSHRHSFNTLTRSFNSHSIGQPGRDH